jgi:hypothetical protein
MKTTPICNTPARWSLVCAFALTISGCAADPNAGGGILTSNAAKVYVYSPEEQAGITPEGTIETMITPSEIRERFKNAGRVTKPTGEVNYCDAGLPLLVQSRRSEALAAVAEACGGQDKVQVRHEGPGNLQARYLGNIKLTPGCTRSRVVIFRCTGAQPKAATAR